MTAPSSLPLLPPDTTDVMDHRRRAERLRRIGEPLVEWLVDSALPRWAQTGVDRSHGGFFEKIGFDGEPIEEPRRARVVARQIYVFATAAKNGWLAGADALVDHGVDFLLGRMKTAAGTIAASVAADGRMVNDRFDLYEHAFVLFALAAAFRNDRGRLDLASEAEALLDRITDGWRHPLGGFEESVPRTLPLRSNPHMHLLEAALAWLEVAPATSRDRWTALANDLMQLCLTRFIGPDGALRECFDGRWEPMPGAEGAAVEPGHQFEWAWLLMRSARLSPEASSRRLAAAARLLDVGERHGVDPVRGVAVNALGGGLRVIDGSAKLWPQTERIKAWHLAASTADADAAATAEKSLLAAVAGLQRYFVASPRGLWREQMTVGGAFDLPDCRASSLYHIVCAIDTVAGGTNRTAA